MKLIDEWRSAHRFLSVRISALAGVAMAAWVAAPTDQQHAVLSVLGADTPAVMAVIGFAVVAISRVIQQTPPPPKE